MMKMQRSKDYSRDNFLSFFSRSIATSHSFMTNSRTRLLKKTDKSEVQFYFYSFIRKSMLLMCFFPIRRVDGGGIDDDQIRHRRNRE